MSDPIGRRQFLGQAATATAILTAASYGQILGANERIRLGIIGSGGRGRNLMRTFLKNKEVEFDAVCDVYEASLQLGLKEAGSAAQGQADYRQLLDDKTIQAVVIA